MNIILLSGGSGKRLWPLSNNIRSKQFLKLFKYKNSFESMIQRMYRQITEINFDANVVVATSKSQASIIRNQLGDKVDISIEPARKDTFAAIALAVLYLKDVKKIDINESVVVCPVDPFVNSDYFNCLKEMNVNVENSNLTLMGIKPTYPSEKYGYIIPKTNEKISKVLSFKEKPTAENARRYINRGALWNGGVFAFKIKYLVEIANKYLGTTSYHELFEKYQSLEKISFDYAVVEKEKNIEVVKFDGEWKDIGTWNTLVESIDSDVVGYGIQNNNTNVHIINELNIPIIACGLKNVVISASPDGVLVSDKKESSYIKSIVDSINQMVMYAEKSWGSYEVIDIESKSLIIKASLKAGYSMSYHSHSFRDEIWTVISGRGITVLDGCKNTVDVGDTIFIKKGVKHTITAIDDLIIIEVQIGDDININDKNKYGFPTE